MDQEWEEIDDYYKEYGEFPLPKVNDSDLIGESGVYTVAGRVLDDIKWLFRDQPKFDTGVDAHIEVRDVMRNATGRLIGVQIKSGKSFFAQSKDKGHHFIFYGELKHYKYWLTQSLPIIITLVNPVNKECYWQYVKSDTVVEPSETGSVTFKIKIPKYQKLNEQCKELLETVALNQTMEQAKYNILKSVKYLIEELNKGNEIHLICTEKIFQSG
ncbi:MAG TPA: DUF4365 domain-containing protein, partial [Chondromyces sp.]|nr:DUF4365 domain-containing protein [Chondromyces sp.]